jgi:isoamylase
VNWDGLENQAGCIVHENEGGTLCLLFNAAPTPCRFVVPPVEESWQIAVDTAASSPGTSNIVCGELTLEARTTVILVSKDAMP